MSLFPWRQSLSDHTHLVRDAGDEVLDVELSGTALLTGGVGTLETSGGLFEGSSLTQGGVLDVLKVMLLWSTRLWRGGGACNVGLSLLDSKQRYHH